VGGRATSEQRVAEVLDEMRSLFQNLESARHDAGEGDLSSWNPLRNWANNQESLLRLKLLTLKDRTDDVATGVRGATESVAGGAEGLVLPQNSRG